ncbi:MAG: hypothetical protein ACREIA_17430, partial [Opitutaceae bacterium]
MSTNEETRETPSDAAETRAAPTPAASPAAPAPASHPRSHSRFYSRMGRSAQAGATDKPPASVVPAEGLTPEEAVNLKLKDNLPVRATMGNLAEFSPAEGRDDAPRDPRRERSGRG